MKPNILTAILLICFSSFLNAQRVKVSRLEDSDKIKQGLFYSLPQTILKVEVVVKKTESIKPVYESLSKKLTAQEKFVPLSNPAINCFIDIRGISASRIS